ncbi:MAG: T9SS C-terminal target domain-containing protein [Ignavibacteriae bacterium]|nr:MAG: T9SS C-terminal target domain-containing protein [Ignavibacteriota bacterium]
MKTAILTLTLIVIFSSQIYSQNQQAYDSKYNYWKIESDNIQSNYYEPDLFTWQYIQSSTTSQITDIFFIDDKTGWATHSGNGGMRTIDGGFNWTNNIFNDSNFNTVYNGVFFINQNTGWEVGGALQIRKTTNGGVNWFKQTPPTAAGVFNNVYFFNENTGIAIGRKNANYNSFMARTTNSGANWTEMIVSTSNENELSDQFWFDANTGWVCGRNVLLKSTNGGLNYVNYFAGIPPTSNGANALLSITFVNQQTGWIGGSNLDKQNIYKTTNGGMNWVFQPNPVTTNTYSQINDVIFLSQDSGWAIHGTPVSGAIMFTTNAGINWTIEEGSSNWFDCLTYYQRIKAWCGASAGKVWFAAPLIVTGINNNNETAKTYKLDQNYPNPFNPVTIINYQLAMSNYVKLVIYDVMGREAATLVNEKQNPGNYEIEWDASNYPSGLYFYKLTVEDFSQVRKMILMK